MNDEGTSPAGPDADTPDPSPGFDLATLAGMMQMRARTGWKWDEKAQTLVCPDDPRLYFSIDPITRRISFSPELAAILSRSPGQSTPEEER